MPNLNNKILKELKSLNITNSEVRVFFVRTKQMGMDLGATVIRVEPKTKLIDKLKKTATKRIDSANIVDSYEPETTDVDDGLLTADAKEVNWNPISDKVLNGKTIQAESLDHLKNCNLLMTEFLLQDNRSLFSVQNLPTRLSPRKLSLQGVLWSDKHLELLDEDSKVINLTIKIDFFVWDNQVFVTNKKEFEKALNLREGMRRKSEALYECINKSGKFTGTDSLRELVGTNMTLMRRATSAHNSGNITDEQFIKDLENLVKKYPEWNIQVKDDRIHIDKENAETVLYLLNDARAETLIKKQILDVKSGKIVSKK